MYIKLFVIDSKIKDWLDREGYKVSTILMIIKKNLHIKNGQTIITNYYVERSFINTKLCWKTEDDYNQIVRRINDILTYSTIDNRYRNHLCYIEKSGSLVYLPYYTMKTGETEERSLEYYTIDKTVDRWILEKF